MESDEGLYHWLNRGGEQVVDAGTRFRRHDRPSVAAPAAQAGGRERTAPAVEKGGQDEQGAHNFFG